MSSLRGRAAFLFLLFSLLVVAAPVRAQGGTPPPPTPPPSLVETCLDEGVGKCLAEGWQRGGGLLVIVLGAALLALALLRPYAGGWMERWKKQGEQDADDFFAADKLSTATRAYLEKAIEDYRYFKFRGLDTRARGIETPELDQAYISVRMTPEAEHPPSAEAVEEGEGLPLREMRLGRGEPPEALELTGAIARSSKLAIVGAAGSGKSTLLQWAGLAVARARLKQKLPAGQKAFIEALEGGDSLLPVIVPLRAFNRYCEENKKDRTAAALLDFIATYIAEQHPALDLPADFFARALSQGCLLMFDGVDEVDPEDRERVREAIEGLVREFAAQPRNRYLVTSRTIAYFGAAEVSGFRKCDVQPLTPDQRDSLIRSWCGVAYPGDEARKQAADLCGRIAASDERVRSLAVTPLMTTIFALVHYDRRELPRQRAELYEHAVRILLTEPYKEGEAKAGLEKWGGLDWETRRNRLARIAFELHVLRERGDALPEDDLLDLIWPAFGPAADEKKARDEARRFARLVADRGGLLEEENRRYGFFTHRTFREFLAGRYLAEENTPDEQSIFLSAHLADDHWAEPARLAAGYLAIAGERRANDFLKLLAGLGASPADRASALALAGLALSDLPADRVLPDTRQSLTAAMLEAFTANPPTVEPILRRPLGLALGALGDPRFVAAIVSNANAILPQLVTIPEGKFRMGTSDDDIAKLAKSEIDWRSVEWFKNEQPSHKVSLSEFAIGKYPVTNAEYRLFWEAKGYENQDYWSDDGWRWLNGQLEADLSIYDKDFRKRVEDWLKGRPVDKRRQPFFWDDPQWNGLNLPVVGVTWYEAEAYCKWLSAVTGEKYRLPTEAEWEKAARTPPPAPPLAGNTPGEGRLWPWGDEWDPNKCNSEESKFGATTPAGMYPDGTYPNGPLDMVGNVWEWCADWWQTGVYKEREGKEVRDPIGPSSGSARVVRGGSWYSYRGYSRAAVRNWYDPALFLNYIGFRVGRSPVLRS